MSKHLATCCIYGEALSDTWPNFQWREKHITSCLLGCDMPFTSLVPQHMSQEAADLSYYFA